MLNPNSSFLVSQGFTHLSTHLIRPTLVAVGIPHTLQTIIKIYIKKKHLKTIFNYSQIFFNGLII